MPSGWRNSPSQHQTVSYSTTDETFVVGYRFARSGLHVEVDGVALNDVRLIKEGSHGVVIRINGMQTFYRCHKDDLVWYVSTNAGAVTFTEAPRFPTAVVAVPTGSLLAPMPGRVVSVEAAAGDTVTAGQTVVVIEAMKMEHTIAAPSAGILESVDVAVGDQVEANQILASLVATA